MCHIQQKMHLLLLQNSNKTWRSVLNTMFLPKKAIWLSLPVSENFAEQKIFFLNNIKDPLFLVQFQHFT